MRGKNSFPPVQDIPKNHPIPKKTIPRVTEGGQTVLFKKEMAAPGKAISDDGQ